MLLSTQTLAHCKHDTFYIIVDTLWKSLEYSWLRTVIQAQYKLYKYLPQIMKECSQLDYIPKISDPVFKINTSLKPKTVTKAKKNLQEIFNTKLKIFVVAVWYQWAILVRWRCDHPDHHLLHPVHYAEDQGSWSQNLPSGEILSGFSHTVTLSIPLLLYYHYYTALPYTGCPKYNLHSASTLLWITSKKNWNWNSKKFLELKD